jgi:hypothetical protein
MVCPNFGRQYIAERFQQAVVVEPGYPFQGGRLIGLMCLPGSDWSLYKTRGDSVPVGPSSLKEIAPSRLYLTSVTFFLKLS